MKDHCNHKIVDLEDEVQRLKSEKARLLDRLQLPESERASLAAEENEIAELKQRLEDYEIRYGDAVVDNEDLRQEVSSAGVVEFITKRCRDLRCARRVDLRLFRPQPYDAYVVYCTC